MIKTFTYRSVVLISRCEKLQNRLPYLVFFESGGDPLLIIYLAIYGLFIYMFVIFYEDIKFELILWEDNIQFGTDG